MKKECKPFGIKDQWGYFFGDVGGSFVNVFVDAYFLTYCTYVLGISAKWMASLFLVARLWDAINDPLIGSLPDRFHLGKTSDKFKPYIKLFMIPLALSCVLCFLEVPFTGVALHAWVAFVYVLYGMSYTGTSMPYGAMSSVITENAVERAKLSRARSFGAAFVSVSAMSIVPVYCFDQDSNIIPSRFTIVATIFGLLSILFYTLTVNMTTERVHREVKKTNDYSMMQVIKDVLHNRQMIGVMVASIGSLVYLTAANSMRTYIYKEYYQNTSIMGIVTVASTLMMFPCFFLVPKLIEKWGKRNLVLYSSIFSFVIFGLQLLLPTQNVYLFSAVNVIGSMGQYAFIMIVWALVNDCIDYTEWTTGKRNDGSMYSIYTFSRKIGTTIASSLSAYGLSAIGYISGTNIAQSAETISGIRTLVCVFPVIAAILEIVGIGLIFNLTKEKTEQMYNELAERNQSTRSE